MIYLALYKGRKQGRDMKTLVFRGLDWAVRRFTGGIYSHCELAVQQSPDVFHCYSASLRDGGVRVKTMALPSDKWDLIPLSNSQEINASMNRLFNETQGAKYDYLGTLGVILPLPQVQKRWFCSEWCASALGFSKPSKLSPNDLAQIKIKALPKI